MRRLLGVVLILLAIVLPAVAAWSAWAYGEATDSGRFAGAARALADDADVQRAVADRLVVVADARLAAAPVAGDRTQVYAQVRSIADRLVASPDYRAALRLALRGAHAQMAARLTGDVASPLRLDLDPLAVGLRDRLIAAGLSQVANAVDHPGSIVIADRSEVTRARQGFDVVRIARMIAVPGAALALLGVIFTARRPGAGLLRAALCLAAAVMLGTAAWALVRDALPDDVTVAVFDVLSRPLRGWAIGGAVGAGLLATAAAVLSAARHRAARAARHPWAHLPRP